MLNKMKSRFSSGKKLFSILLTCGVFSAILNYSFLMYAQVNEDWVQRYNGPGNGNDYGTSMAIDGSGDVYVTGSSVGLGTGPDYATLKYNSSGVQQWVARYNGTGDSIDFSNSIAVHSSGNVYVTGASTGNGTSLNYATIGYNSSGVQKWVRTYNGPGNGDDDAKSIVVHASGSVYVTGWSIGIETGHDYATIKYSSRGGFLWVARYNGPANGWDEAVSIALDGAGNVYVTGWSTGSGTGPDYVTIKYNSSGVQQWLARYDAANDFDRANSIALDGSGNVYVTGASTGNGGSVDFATIKYNSSGVQQWVARYNGTGNGDDYAYAIAVSASGNVFVTGVSTGNGTSFNYATIRYNSSGVQQWVRTYNGPGNGDDFPSSIAIDGSGHAYVTGFSTGSRTDAYDYATLKYNSRGGQQWLVTYNGPGNSDDYANSIAVDNSGHVYVTGHSLGSGTGFDYATIKYSESSDRMQISSQIPETFRLEQNYPNPFNPTTTIRFDNPGAQIINLCIYDILGREMETIVNEQLNAGTYEVDFDASNYSSGVYYYKLTAGDYSAMKKMVLIK